MNSVYRIPYLSDANWEKLESALSRFGSLAELVELQLASPFDADTIIPDLESSYKKNGYQYLFYSIVRLLRPKKIIEIGVLQGFSLLSMAHALRENGHGTIEGYDLFDDYEFKKDRQENVESRISELELESYGNVFKQDAFEVYKEVSHTDILHVDISNNGEVVERMFSLWEKKVSNIIVFEGGAPDRDNIHWMREYDKVPMVPVFEKLEQLHDHWEFITLGIYPSITVCLKTPR